MSHWNAAAETNSGRSDRIKVDVHTEELNKCLIPDNETATAEGKDQLQLSVQLEVDWFTTSNCHLFSLTEAFIESLDFEKKKSWTWEFTLMFWN